ncbi:MAG: hypothetical protein R2692_01200 [Microbacterium sp.]
MTKLEPGTPALIHADRPRRAPALAPRAARRRHLDGGRGVILSLYPAAMTPGCTTEATPRQPAPLQAAGYAVVGYPGATPPEKPAGSASATALTYDSLSDPDHAVQWPTARGARR